MIGIARRLLQGERTGNCEMHLEAARECLPIFAAAGHNNYVKSSYHYLQQMYSLEAARPDMSIQAFYRVNMSFAEAIVIGLESAVI